MVRTIPEADQHLMLNQKGATGYSNIVIFTITMSYLVGHLSVKAFRREATVSVMLGIFLGLGLLFLSLTLRNSF